MHKNTKIVATLGPATESKTVIKKLVQGGMNVARLNFSHGTHANHLMLLKNVRAVSKDLNVPVAIMQDLQGPKIRIGELKAPINVKRGEIITLSTKKTPHTIPVQYKRLPKEVSKGTTIFVNDGMVELKVTNTNKKDRISCKVITGGEIDSRKGVNVVDGNIKASTLTKKDIKDLEFGIKYNVDFIALSFVKSADDIKNLRKRLKGKDIKIIAKIERKEAVDETTLEEIINAADGVMVARGDLGVELRPEYVPLYQKQIIQLANKAGKPVITATQMLTSMLKNPRPTRAEVSDIANAILDKTDAVMLSNETSVGDYPIKAVQMMKKIAKVIEAEMRTRSIDISPNLNKDDIECALAHAGTNMALDVNADLIVVLTSTGKTAREVAKYRVQKNIYVVTGKEKTKNQLTLTFGLNRLYCTKNFAKRSVNEILQEISKKARIKKSTNILVIDARKGMNKIQTVNV